MLGKSTNELTRCEDGHTSWNLREQIFTVCVSLPSDYRGVGFGEATDIYLRPVLSNAYRNSIWPEEASKINKFVGRLKSGVEKDGKELKVSLVKGTLPVANDKLQIVGEKDTYRIQDAPTLETGGAGESEEAIYTITLSTGVKEAHAVDTKVSVNAGLVRAFYELKVDTNYQTKWNAKASAGNRFLVSSGSCTNNDFASTECLGYATQTIITNWLGNRGFDNNWADSSLYDSLKATERRRLFLGSDKFNVGSFDPVSSESERSAAKFLLSDSASDTCALLKSGGVQCWGAGWGSNGGVRSLPSYVSGLTNGVRELERGGSWFCALLESGGVKCWSGPGRTPVQVVGLASGVRKIALGGDSIGHACALLENGGVKCWGSNEFGQLGGGNAMVSETPVYVAGLTSRVRDIMLKGYNSCALLESGGVRCWGRNRYVHAPSQVVGLTSGVRDFVLGSRSSCALSENGAAKCLGYNSDGRLGIGTHLYSETPVQVIGLTSGVRKIALGGDSIGHACALLENGVVKCWGSNEFGQLGNGTNAIRSLTPVQVLDLTNRVLDIVLGSKSSCALLENGVVKCWGTVVRGVIWNLTVLPNSSLVSTEAGCVTSR